MAYFFLFFFFLIAKWYIVYKILPWLYKCILMHGSYISQMTISIYCGVICLGLEGSFVSQPFSHTNAPTLVKLIKLKQKKKKLIRDAHSPCEHGPGLS